MIAAINHNITAYAVQRALSKHESQIYKSLERLASGNRINRAADDAAGMVISKGLEAESRGLQQFHRNVMRAQSILSMADGSAQDIFDILLQLKEWAIQAATDTVSDEERNIIHEAFNMLSNEIDSIVGRSKFNGRSLLDGDYNVELYLPGDKLNIALNSGREGYGLTTAGLGLTQHKTSWSMPISSSSDLKQDTSLNNLDQVFPKLEPGDIIHISGMLPDGSPIDENASFIFGSEGTTLNDLMREINNAFLTDDVDRGATVKIFRNADTKKIGHLGLTDNISPTLEAPSQTSIRLTVEPNSTPPILTGENALDFSSPLSVAGNIGFSFILSSQDEKAVDLDDVPNAGSININGIYNDIDALVSEINGLIAENDNLAGNIIAEGVDNKIRFKGVEKQITSGEEQITSLDISGTALNNLGFPSTTPNSYTRSLFDPAEFELTQVDESPDISFSRETAENAISVIDSAVDLVGKFLAHVGGLSSRLTRAESALSSDIMNVNAAISTISDTDFAAEVSQLARSQILQQVGISLLTQANMIPKIILSLLP